MSLISTIISSSIPRSPKIDEIDASGSAVSDRSDNELFIIGNNILIVDAISLTGPKLTSVWWWVGWWADHTIGIAQENMLQLALTHNEASESGRLTTTRVLASSVIKTTMEKVKPELVSAYWVPLLRSLLPKTETNAIGEIAKLLVSPQFSGRGMNCPFQGRFQKDESIKNWNWKSNQNGPSTSFINASGSEVKWRVP